MSERINFFIIVAATVVFAITVVVVVVNWMDLDGSDVVTQFDRHFLKV